MRLSLNQKIALILTSAHSQRNAASLIGCSHQQIGRWIKPNENGEYKQIPQEWAESIEIAFSIHTELTREQAAVDGLPFFKEIPVYAEKGLLRKTDKKGKRIKGDRVIIEKAQYMDAPLRDAYLRKAYKSKQFHHATVGSTVSAYEYARNKASLEIKTRRDKSSKALKQLTRAILANFYTAESVKTIEEKDHKQRFYIKKVEFGKAANNENFAMRQINNQLREKHEPAAISFADEIIFQTFPANYVTAQTPTRAKAKTTKPRNRNKRGK